jgi:hypothetical protein
MAWSATASNATCWSPLGDVRMVEFQHQLPATPYASLPKSLAVLHERFADHLRSRPATGWSR